LLTDNVVRVDVWNSDTHPSLHEVEVQHYTPGHDASNLILTDESPSTSGICKRKHVFARAESVREKFDGLEKKTEIYSFLSP